MSLGQSSYEHEVVGFRGYIICNANHLIRKGRLRCLYNSRGVVELRPGGSERSLILGLAAQDPVAMWWLGLTYELETTLVWSPSSSCNCPLAFYVSLDLSCSLSGQSTGLEEENNLLQG